MFRFRKFIPWLVACVAAPLVHAAAGALDPSFGRGGLLTIQFANNIVPIKAMLQPDGHVLVAAGFDNTSAATESFGLVRLNANGTLDRSFGNGGVALTEFTNFINSPSALALQSDAKIVVVGNATSADGTLSEFAVVRFNPNGTLDTTFGQGGKVTTNFVGVQLGGVSNPASAVLVLPSGQILVAGLASQCAKCPHLTALARYNADGSLDAGFGTGGLVAVQAIATPNALALLSNGDVLALSASAIAEFAPNGALVGITSTTQGATLIERTDTGNSAFAPNGQFIFAGSATGPFGRHDTDIHVTRFNPLGTVDPLFVSPTFDFVPMNPLSASVQAIAMQPNGQIVVGGVANPVSGTSAFGLARLNADGGLDPAFGNQGTVVTIFSNRTGSFSFVNSLVLLADGKIVAVGLAGNHLGQTFLALARYLTQ